MADDRGNGLAGAVLNTREALLALCALLAPNEPTVAARVAAAHDDPVGYVRTHAGQLLDRGIDTPIEDLAWIALVDVLDEHDLLAEIDWKEASGEIYAQLRLLRSALSEPRAWTWAKEIPPKSLSRKACAAATSGDVAGVGAGPSSKPALRSDPYQPSW